MRQRRERKWCWGDTWCWSLQLKCLEEYDDWIDTLNQSGATGGLNKFFLSSFHREQGKIKLEIFDSSTSLGIVHLVSDFSPWIVCDRKWEDFRPWYDIAGIWASAYEYLHVDHPPHLTSWRRSGLNRHNLQRWISEVLYLKQFISTKITSRRWKISFFTWQ